MCPLTLTRVNYLALTCMAADSQFERGPWLVRNHQFPAAAQDVSRHVAYFSCVAMVALFGYT